MLIFLPETQHILPALTKNSNIIVGVSAHKTNIHDSKTLDLVLNNAVSNVGIEIINEAICDRGYRGTSETIINDDIIPISIPGIRLKRDTRQQIKIKKEKFKRRAAIEPIIGHMKSDHRMARNYLKGFKEASMYRNKIMTLNSVPQILEILLLLKDKYKKSNIVS